MLIHISKSWFVASVLFVSLLACSASAQEFQPFGPVDHVHDLQLFAPIDLANIAGPPDPNEGYFFGYQRLYWNVTGLRGPAGMNVPLFTAIEPHVGRPNSPQSLVNSITDAPPDSLFSWGQRYEIGYMQPGKGVEDGNGWIAGILDGPNQNHGVTLGFIDPDNPGNVDPDADVLGGVIVLFTHASGLLIGFLDRETGAQGGANIPDGFADDLDDDGVFGPDGQDADGDGVPDTVFPPVAVDWDDAVEFPTAWPVVNMRNFLRIDGVELMKMHRFARLHGGSILEIFYGARFLSFDDRFVFSGIGGTFADSNWDTKAQNNLIGPQLGGRLYNTRGRWTFNIEGRFLAAANIQNFKQTVNVGTLMVPGAHNGPVSFNPFAARHARSDTDFSPVGELRVETALRVTKAISLKVGYTGLYAGNMARAANVVRYDLDTQFGLLPSDRQDIITNGVNFGIEINR